MTDPQHERREIESLVGDFFAAFATGSDLPDRMRRLRDLFVEEAVVTRLCGLPPLHMSVEEFVRPRQALLESEQFTSFSESPLHGNVEMFGDLAHWFGAYTTTWTDDSGTHHGAGMKSIQFARTTVGWRITAVAWDDQRNGLDLADHVIASSERSPDGIPEERFPVTTPRLALRPHRPGDLADLLRFHADPEVVRFLPWPVRDEAETRDALEKKLDAGRLIDVGQWLVLAIEHRACGKVIGEGLLKWSSREHRQGEIGYALARDHQGRGLGREAARKLLSLGFDDLGLHRIIALCLEENQRSAHLLTNLGMRHEAHLVDDLHFKGRWVSRDLYAMTRPEWRSRPAKMQLPGN